MELERSERVRDLVNAALELAPEERVAFVDKESAGDNALRFDVERLLAREDSAEHFMETSAVRVVARELADQERDLCGQQIGHYRILKPLGAGGMGAVFLAEDLILPRQVALKVLPLAFTANADRVRRFEQEAHAVSALNHPNILTIHEIRRQEDLHFIVSEFINGQTLRERMNGRPIGTQETIEIGMKIASALIAAHNKGIVHRDIKPENVMLRSDGSEPLVKVLDFGIAKLNGEFWTGNEGRIESVDPINTSVGTVVGTASYMSPEQARGEPLDGRTDLFSLGLILYEMATGHHLFSGRLPAEVIQTLRGHDEFLSPNAKLDGVPKELARIIKKALRKNREERYGSATELLADLNVLQDQLATRGSRRVITVMALALVLALIGAAGAVWGGRNEEWTEVQLREGHTAAARQAAFSPDGKWLVSVGEDKQVIVWNFARRERRATLADHTDIVPAVAFSPDGKWFATGSHDKTVIIWDAVRLEKVQVLTGHPGKINAVAFSPNGRLLASSSEWTSPEGANERTILWDVSSWKPARILRSGFSFETLFFSPDSRRLMSSQGGSWDVSTGRQVADHGEDGFSGNWGAISPDGTRLAFVTGGGTVAFSDLSKHKIIGIQSVHQDHGRAVTFSPDGRLAASGAEDIVLWDAAKQEIILRWEHSALVRNLTFSPDGRWLVSTHGDGAILVWDVVRREVAANLSQHGRSVRAVAFSPDGRRVASAGEDRSVMVWDAEQRQQRLVMRGHETRVTAVAFSPDGTWLASIDHLRNLVAWDLERRQSRWTLREPAGVAYCVAVSPNGRWVATSNAVYESAGGHKVGELYATHPEAGPIYGLAFSPDGRRLACVTEFGWIFLHGTDNWTVVDSQQLRDTHLIGVSFSLDGKHLVTGEVENAVRLWSVEPLREVGVLGRHDARISSVAFSPNSQWVVSAGADRNICLWDVRWRRLVTRVGTHSSGVLSVAFSPDGKRIASAEDDSSVRLYTHHRTFWGRRLD